VFVGPDYEIRREVVVVGQSRPVKSYWTESTIFDAKQSRYVATVLLHQGVFKASFAEYPSD